MEDIIDVFLKGMIIFSSVMIFACFIRAVIGPTIPDRLMAVNMIGTQVIIIIAILTILLGEAWLADVATVYALISFLGVVVLTKIYIGIYRKEHAHEFEKQQEGSKKDKGGKNVRLKGTNRREKQ